MTDIPQDGLSTEWIVWSSTVALEVLPGGNSGGEVLVVTVEAGDKTQWMARFGSS